MSSELFGLSTFGLGILAGLGGLAALGYGILEQWREMQRLRRMAAKLAALRSN